MVYEKRTNGKKHLPRMFSLINNQERKLEDRRRSDTVLKAAGDSIIEPLMYLFNLVFEHWYFSR